MAWYAVVKRGTATNKLHAPGTGLLQHFTIQSHQKGKHACLEVPTGSACSASPRYIGPHALASHPLPGSSLGPSSSMPGSGMAACNS